MMNSDKNIALELEQEMVELQRRDRKRTLVLGSISAIVLALGVAAFVAAGPQNTVTTGSAGNARYQLTSQGGAVPNAGSGGSCCTTTVNSVSETTSPERLSNTKIHQLALVQYELDTGNKAAKGVINDFGCHLQVDILDASGVIVGSYGYQGGDSVYRIK